jgi:hypothetical protein
VLTPVVGAARPPEAAPGERISDKGDSTA